MPALSSGVFRRPVLRLRRGTCLTPYEGFKRGLGPLRGPSRLRLGALVPRGLERRAREFLRNLVFGVRGYGGLAEWFECWVEWPPELVSGEYREYPELASELSDVDVALAFIPDEHYRGYEEDPYLPAKRAFALEGVPSQMVTTSTLRYLADKSYVLFNLALSVYGKAGGVPWSLAEPLSADLYIGLDTVGTGVAVTVLSARRGLHFAWHVALNPDVEVIRTLEGALLEALEAAASCARGTKSVVVHRDGRCFEEEVGAVRSALERASDAGILAPSVEWSLVEVRKRVAPRVVGRRFGRHANPEKGTYYALGQYEYLVVTTGFPEHPYILESGLVRPIVVELVEATSWEVSVRDIARDVYWLSELHWASAFSSSRLPITTLYAHRICSFWRAGVQPSEEYYDKLWFL